MLVAEFNGHMPPKCWTADANVDRDVQNASTHYTHQFSLWIGVLQVKAAQDAL
jgi:hypothetical protein